MFALNAGADHGPSSIAPSASIRWAPAPAQEVVVSLRRESCWFGKCPVYSVEARSDGWIEFQGHAHVAATGRHTAKVDPSLVARLAQEARDLGFLDLTQEEADDCPEYWTDNETVFLTVRIGDHENTIKHYHGCRGGDAGAMLESFEDRVDEVLFTARWVKGTTRRAR